MYDEFPKKSTSGTSANGGPVWKRRLLYKLSIFWGSILVLGSVVAGFLPPNFSQKKIYCAAVKVDRLPRHHHVYCSFNHHHHHVYCSFNHHHHCHSGYSSFNHHHHVYCLSSSLYFTCLFRIALWTHLWRSSERKGKKTTLTKANS